MNSKNEVLDPPYQLFHRIADKDCVQVRAKIGETAKPELVRFRNVDTGPEALADLIRLSGKDTVPVLRVSESTIVEGKADIFAWLEKNL